ncbi:MAG TPA: hypothetical protein VF483_00690 [Gemmatimonadaceae bacterium]
MLAISPPALVIVNRLDARVMASSWSRSVTANRDRPDWRSVMVPDSTESARPGSNVYVRPLRLVRYRPSA